MSVISKRLSTILQSILGKAFLLCTLIAALLALGAAISTWFSLTASITLISFAILFVVALLFLMLLALPRFQEPSFMILYQQNVAFQQLLHLIDVRLPLPPTRQGAASPDLLVLISHEILVKKPEVVLECGAGVSTLVQGYLLEKLGRGRLYSLEHNPVWAERVGQWVIEHKLTQYVTIIYAPLTNQNLNGSDVNWYDPQRVQPLLEILPPIDFLFVDGPPGEREDTRRPAIPILRRALATDAEIIMDDTKRDYEKRAAIEWAKELNYDLEFIDNEKGAAWLRPRPETGTTETKNTQK